MRRDVDRILVVDISEEQQKNILEFKNPNEHANPVVQFMDHPNNIILCRLTNDVRSYSTDS